MKTFLALTIAGLLMASGSARAQDQSGCLRVEKIQVPHNLKPGGVLHIRVRLKTSHCVLDNAFDAGTTTTFFVEPRPGFESTIGTLVYSGLEKRLSSQGIPQAHVLETTIAVKVSQVLEGKYDVPVSLNYQAVDEHGTIRNESVHFAIPVTVSFWDKQTGVRNGFVIAGEVTLIVLLWPVWVLKCLFVGGCSNC